MRFDAKGDYDFAARLTTAGREADLATLSGLSSLGKGPEVSTITVRDAVSDLTRLPYNPSLADPS